ncbi:acyltransferase family protein [Caulobacter soli]|uniref:acyltransferase family protein n=1 Tax=Caulobacter soli TaxID=2708539 RepID=UPI0013EC015A|nr:acyltransferase [Caulobacter soli]
MTTDRRKQIVGLQHLRGLAALAVVVDHGAGMAAFPKYFGQSILSGHLEKGTIGVDLFFVISGLIIATVALEITTLRAKISITDFALRRLIRIVPLMWIAILSYAALRLAGRGLSDFSPYVNALFLLPTGPVVPQNIWTLRHELVFYSAFALTFLLFPRARWLILIWIFSFIPVALFAHFHPADNPALYAAKIFGNPVNIEFGAGLALGLLCRRRDIRSDLSTPAPALLLIAAFVGFFLLAIVLDLKIDQIQGTMISAIVASAIIFLAVKLKFADSGLNRVGSLLGDASYSIYLFHPHFQSAMLGVWKHFLPQTNIWIVILGVVLLSTAAGVLIHLFVEKPLLTWLGRFLPRRGDHHGKVAADPVLAPTLQPPG